MRKNEQWFELNGVKSLDMGVSLIDAPAFFSPARRMQSYSISARHGRLFVSDGSFELVEIKRACRVPLSKLRALKAWLAKNAGAHLRFSTEPDAIYQARLSNEISFRQIASGEDPLLSFSLTWLCQPMSLLYPPADDLVFTAAGTIENPCTAESLPRVKIEGSGAFSLTIGSMSMFFRNVEGGVIVDSELGDVLTLDASQTANDLAEGEFFHIPVGESAVSFQAGGEDESGNTLSGEIEKITITPRWRWL